MQYRACRVGGVLCSSSAGDRSQDIYPISLYRLMRSQRPTKCVASRARHCSLWRLFSPSPLGHTRIVVETQIPQRKAGKSRETEKNTSIFAPDPPSDGGNPPAGRDRDTPSTPEKQPHIPRTNSGGWTARQLSEATKSHQKGRGLAKVPQEIPTTRVSTASKQAR